MPGARDDIYDIYNKTWSPGLSNQSMFERLQRAGFDVRDLIRENQEYDIEEALETVDRVSAALINHDNSYRTRELGALASRLESATRSLRQIYHRNCEASIKDEIPDAGGDGEFVIGSKALKSLDELHKKVESSVLPQALAHTMAAQEEKSKRRLQALLNESRGWGNKDRLNRTFDSIGSPPEEAVKCLRWLGQGMPQDSMPRSLSKVRWVSSNDTHDVNGLKTMDKQQVTELSESIKALGLAEEPDAMGEPGLPRTAEDAGNDNHDSDSSSSSGEEESWPEEAYKATCARPSSQGEQWSGRQNPNFPRDGYMAHTNGIDRTQYQRPRAYTAIVQPLNTISEDSEGETAVEERRCASESMAKDATGDGSPRTSRSEEKCIVSAPPGVIDDVVDFKEVKWNASTQPRNSSTNSASTKLDPISQKKSK